MPLLTPPPIAPKRGDRTTFADRLDAFVTWLVNFVTELLALVAGLNSLAAGGAYSIPYVFDAGTADAAPGVGKLRLSSLPQSSSSTLRLDLSSSSNQDFTSVIDKFDVSTSTVKGSIRLEKMGDPSAWLTFDVLARAAPAGYRNITVVNTGGSAASPFTAGDGIMLFFTRNGDKGSQGLMGPGGGLSLLSTDTISTAAASINRLTLFSDTYDKYTIDIQGIAPSASDGLSMRLAFGGTLAGAAGDYRGLAVDGGSGGINSRLIIGPLVSTNATMTIEIRNARSTNKPKGIGVRGMCESTSVLGEGGTGGSAATTSVACSGFSLFWSSAANFTTGTVRVYGHATA